MAVGGYSDDYEFLRQMVLARSQNVLDPARDFVFEAKLARLVRNSGWSDLREIVERICGARRTSNWRQRWPTP